MTYAAIEESQATGRPIELYLFQNALEQFAYTSGPTPITFNGVEYEPRSISRSKTTVDSGEAGLDRGLEVTLPADDPFALRYVASVPSSFDEVTIYRFHVTDTPTPETIIVFKGIVASVAWKGEFALVKIRPETARLQRVIPRQTYRNLCSHMLYDSGCKISDLNPLFRFAVTITSISADGLSLTVVGAGISGKAADFFLSGFLRQAGLDHRMVLSFTDLGGDTATVGILVPFQSAAVGGTLELLAGCDRSAATCDTKFANIVNFGGFPWVPTRNPFQTGVVF